ncbi:MAG: Uncharacterised protein [Flavobacterium sp. SCGC AAA160-P02]|nr:MAG: Uncharacterised protein [Flavobacterium sp. SCGC AAA160-P02]
MRVLIIIIICILCISSCNSKSDLLNDLQCASERFLNLEKIEDVKKLFIVEFPDTWKTNLYYDKNQSSIYTADTTKQLTESMLLDITYVSKKLTFDTIFVKKFKNNLKNQGLLEKTPRFLAFQNKKAYYSRAIGNKRGFDYQISNLFIKVNQNNYIHAKIEVYGDSLVDQRICSGLQLIEKIQY